MRHICSHCRLTSPDGNLWCQEVDCPAGSLPLLFKYGDYLGNLKILELMRVLRSATIYKVERGVVDERQVLIMKVANPGTENEAYLRNEAEALRTVTMATRDEHSALPKWQPHGAVNGQDAYGIATYGEQTRYFFLMDYVDGEFLTDSLLDNPQPWHEDVGWFMLTLSEAIIRIEKITERLHLNINPDVVMVRRNNAGVPQPVLLDMGLLFPNGKQLPATEAQALQQHLLAAYTPSELIHGGTLSTSADVYSLGLILYEMLAGKPAYPYTLRRTEDIYEEIKQVSPVLRRADLPVTPRRGRKGGRSSSEGVDGLLDIVQRAVRHDHPKRYTNVAEFRQALLNLYGEVMNKRRFDMDVFFRDVKKVAIYTMIGLLVLFVVSILISALTR
ncbi:MAG: protein kinase [Chloroflexi bacterium]|nr:protein kinase [Chloroflexota bacterium]MCC6895923.1 protein kinase [Anaerolineae bacterium]